jgi:hypothetical protein
MAGLNFTGPDNGLLYTRTTSNPEPVKSSEPVPAMGRLSEACPVYPR